MQRLSSSLFISLAILLAAPGALAQRDFSNVEVIPHHVSANYYYLQGAGGNIGISVGEDGVIMIDDQFAPLTDKILAATWESTLTQFSGAYLFAAVALPLAALLTAFYMFRLIFLTFYGEPRDHHIHDHAHESPWPMTVSLIVGSTAVSAMVTGDVA